MIVNTRLLIRWSGVRDHADTPLFANNFSNLSGPAEINFKSICIDFTLTFRRLCDAAFDKKMDRNLINLFKDARAYEKWSKSWRSRLSRESVSIEERTKLMRKVNPAVIPRNHRVEQALNAAVENLDYAPFEKLVEVLSSPYEELEGQSEFMQPPKPGEHVLETFCGT
ncbi:MAG: protein adenylyltransferase SelO family protein [SAR324 cluster bacterium]|nr:protein adenylyltransferase SelO family protein [SAR324 cluster bacterium]